MITHRFEPLLTLITPVHDGVSYIEDSLRRIVVTLEELGRPFEVIVVSDGSTDGTPQAARALADDRVRVLGYTENRGKGFAIALGIEHARGRLVGWLDADLDVHPRTIVDAVRLFEHEQVDAVVGSKRHPGSAVRYPIVRRVLSMGYQVLVRLLFRINVRDTQVGAKVVRREMLDTVAPLLLIKRYAFDLEVLAVGAEFGFDRIRELPVALEYRFTGTGINSRAVRHMLIDTLAIGYRIHLRHWYVRQYAALLRRRMDVQAANERDGSGLDVPIPSGLLSQVRSGVS